MRETDSVSIEVTVDEVLEQVCAARPLIDIRSSLERFTGVPLESVAMSADELLSALHTSPGDALSGGFLLCAGGVRSKQLVEQLRAHGFNGFSSVFGGFRAWRDANLPTDYPPGINGRQAERYARHLVMPQIGPAGQLKLLNSRVLLVGLGGLNSPAALYLAAAGIGTLGLVDDDHVELSNLQRQVSHSESRVGESKVESAAARIREINSDIRTEVFHQRVTNKNADGLVAGWDVVIDGTDNFDGRYALNTACAQRGIPLVYGAVMRFQGQVSVFWPAASKASGDPSDASPCFECLMPVPPAAADTPSCTEAGVLGVLPGIVGTLQAMEALKLVLNLGQPLLGRLLMFDALNMDFREARIQPRRDCSCCGISPPGTSP